MLSAGAVSEWFFVRSCLWSADQSPRQCDVWGTSAYSIPSERELEDKLQRSDRKTLKQEEVRITKGITEYLQFQKVLSFIAELYEECEDCLSAGNFSLKFHRF